MTEDQTMLFDVVVMLGHVFAIVVAYDNHITPRHDTAQHRPT